MNSVSRLLSRWLRPGGSCPTIAPSRACGVEALERRQLLSVTTAPVPAATFPQDTPPQSLNLNAVFRDNTTQLQDLTFAARTDNATLIQTAVANGILTLTTSPSASGFAHVSVSATAPDGSVGTQTLRIQVTAAANRTLTVNLGPGQRSFRFVQANHALATVNLVGPGTGTLVLGGDNLAQVGNHARGANQELESITLTGTTAATRLVIIGVRARRGAVSAGIGNITTDGSLGVIRMKRVGLLGDVTVAGGVSILNMDGAQSGTITLGQSIGRLSLTIGGFADENFSTPAPIGLIRSGFWASTDSVPETFVAASISKLLAFGNFDVGVQLSGAGVTAGRTLGFARVFGVIGGVWNVSGASAPLVVNGTTLDFDGTFGSLPYIRDFGGFGGSLTVPSMSYLRVSGQMLDAILDFTAAGTTDLNLLQVHGQIQSTGIFAAGNLGAISAQSLQGSGIYAGVGPLPQGQNLPASVADLASAASIRSVVLRPRPKVVSFLGSDIAAQTIGRLALGTTRVGNGGNEFGVAATSIARISAHDLTNRRVFAFSNVNDANTLAAQIAALGLNLEDFTIRVLS